MSSPGALGARATDVAPCIHNVLFFHVLHFFLLFLFTFCFVLFRVLRHSFSFLLREKGHTLNQATLGATRGGSDPPVVILIRDNNSPWTALDEVRGVNKTYTAPGVRREGGEGGEGGDGGCTFVH